jgi:hypothetical protein
MQNRKRKRTRFKIYCLNRYNKNICSILILMCTKKTPQKMPSEKNSILLTNYFKIRITKLRKKKFRLLITFNYEQVQIFL